MQTIVDTVLKRALEEDLPVIIIYHGEKEMTQRRIFIRRLDDESVMAYCTVKKGVRFFKKKNILSAFIAED